MTFPTALIDHPDLTDLDVRMLLLLDQIGWREGDQDGRVRSTNAEIASRLRKSPDCVRASLARIEAVRPAIIRRSLADRNTRVVRLVYDRYGSVKPDGERTLTVATVEDACFSGGGILKNKGGDAEKQASPPLRVLDIQDPPEGGDAEKQASPRSVSPPSPSIPGIPTDLSSLVAWLPAIAEDATLLARLHRVVPTWLSRLLAMLPDLGEAEAVDWVQDALVIGASKEDTIPYAKRVLAGWVEAGKRPDAPKSREAPEADESALPVAGVSARRRRQLEAAERIKARLGKEDDDEPRF